MSSPGLPDGLASARCAEVPLRRQRGWSDPGCVGRLVLVVCVSLSPPGISSSSTSSGPPEPSCSSSQRQHGESSSRKTTEEMGHGGRFQGAPLLHINNTGGKSRRTAENRRRPLAKPTPVASERNLGRFGPSGGGSAPLRRFVFLRLGLRGRLETVGAPRLDALEEKGAWSRHSSPGPHAPQRHIPTLLVPLRPHRTAPHRTCRCHPTDFRVVSYHLSLVCAAHYIAAPVKN